MKTYVRTTQFMFSLVALTIMATGQAAFGRGGGAYNGPIFTGDAIPVDLIRGEISAERMVEAVKTCLLTGDPKTGLVSLTQELFRTIYGKYPSPKAVYDYRATVIARNKEYASSMGRIIPHGSICETLAPNKLRRCLSFDDDNIGQGRFNIMYSDPSSTDTFESISLFAERAIGFVEWQEDYTRVQKDSHGRKLKDEVIITKGLQLWLQSNSGRPMPFINASSGLESSFFLDGSQVIGCLNTQIQLQIEKHDK